MADEMDLLSGLKGVEPVRPRAFEEARTVLRAAMAVEERGPRTRRRTRWGTRRAAAFSVAALGAAAAVVAVVLAPASAPSRNAAASGKVSPKASQGAANPILAQLATDIGVEPVKLPGNATLEIRNQSPAGDTLGANGVDLYTDDGTYYWGPSRSILLQVIAQGQDTAEGEFKRDIAAALYAVNGNIGTARAKMAIANLIPGTKPDTAQAQQAAIRKLKAIDKKRGIPYTPPKPLTPAQKKEQTDNFIWMNSIDALTAAPENPQVRAGVLRIMATMPNVKVTHTTTAGQPALTLADSWPLLADPGLVESLVVNASTGFPIALFNTDPGQPLNVTYYHTFRVTLAAIEAGKFPF
ncbi:MAG: hypothetical protein JO345_19040 [Streptosporangiaceae bacterium]|nr:hypothetical protein [Streptosporangiaceae bacterium]